METVAALGIAKPKFCYGHFEVRARLGNLRQSQCTVAGT